MFKFHLRNDSEVRENVCGFIWMDDYNYIRISHMFMYLCLILETTRYHNLEKFFQ